jgi:hypothetical protein
MLSFQEENFYLLRFFEEVFGINMLGRLASWPFLRIQKEVRPGYSEKNGLSADYIDTEEVRTFWRRLW